MGNKGLAEYRRKVKEGLVEKTRDKNRPSAIKAIREKCLDCICAKTEGRIDCEIENCSLYYSKTYRRLKEERKINKKIKKDLQDEQI